MVFDSFVSDVAATVFGGVLLALLFFWAKEKLFPIPRIMGCWHVEVTTEQTSYNPYNGMVLRFVAMLWQEGSRIEGSIEKTYENSSTGERNYVGKDRTRGTLNGCLQKNYFGCDKLYLHVIEDGHGRESTHFYDLTVQKNGTLCGTFSSMVADSAGTVRWQRNSF